MFDFDGGLRQAVLRLRSKYGSRRPQYCQPQPTFERGFHQSVSPNCAWQSTSRTCQTKQSILLRDKVPPLERGLVVVTAFILAFGQFHFFSRNFAIRNEAQEMPDAVKSRLPLIVGPDDVPRSIFCIS